MSKSILIIDTPKCCADCPICAWSEETGLYNCLNGAKDEKCVDDYLLDDRFKKPLWCPLKPLPKKAICYPANQEPYWDGFNDCIDEILGEQK